MVKYATLDDLRRIRRELLTEERGSLVKNAAARTPTGSAFLSHSSLDVEFLPAIIKLLQNHGGSVYVDKKDDDLPPYTSRETALALRKRIAESRNFILFATRNSKNSRWMPWELGVSDGIKQSTRTAILPAVDTSNDYEWAEQEYLGIYDRIVFGDLQGHSDKVWMVLNQQKNTGSLLQTWLEK